SHPPGGVILAIIEPDGKVIAASAGRQSGGDPIPIDGRVRIGSVTKTFVAVLVLQLVDERKVDLDAPARSYVTNSPLPPDVTVRDVLQVTSGLPGDAGRGFRARIQCQTVEPMTHQAIHSVRNHVPPHVE